MGCSHLLLGRVGQSGAETGRSCDGSTLAAEAAGPCTKARRRIRALAGRQRVAAFPLLVGAQRAQRQRVVFARPAFTECVSYALVQVAVLPPISLGVAVCAVSSVHLSEGICSAMCGWPILASRGL